MEIVNKKAFFGFEILERIESGINLTGAEVRAVKLGHADLSGSFVKIIGSEAYLINARIYPPRSQMEEGYDEKRTRKLLLHKREIIAMKSKISGFGLTIVPLKLYTNEAGLIKVEIALAKGLRKFDKRHKKR